MFEKLRRLDCLHAARGLAFAGGSRRVEVLALRRGNLGSLNLDEDSSVLGVRGRLG